MTRDGESSEFPNFGRAESRMLVSTAVRVRSIAQETVVDEGIMQNVSASGMGTILTKRWTAAEPVTVESPPGFFRSRGWIVYCEPLPKGKFAVGVRLLTRQRSWSKAIHPEA